MTITLATLAQATKQQIFDQVARHLLKQGERAVDTGGRCMYRSACGLMCAAGCLISDEEYTPGIDKHGSWSSVVMSGFVGEDHIDLIGALQRMHDADAGNAKVDENDGVVNFEARLAYFVQRHNERYPLEESLVFDPVKLMAITLATLDDHTEQEVFDFVAKHLLKQGVKSVDGLDCVYRGVNSTMCAVGCLISDEEYDIKMDIKEEILGTSWTSLVDRKLVKSSKHDGLLCELQTAHDGANPGVGVSFEFGLKRIALNRKLEYKHIPELAKYIDGVDA